MTIFFQKHSYKTLKYRTDYHQDGFKNIEDAREWVYVFVDWYNNKHYHSGLNFLTPSSKHSGKDEEIMAHRRKVYNTAREMHTLKFNKEIRNWTLHSAVAHNPTEGIKDKLKNTAI